MAAWQLGDAEAERLEHDVNELVSLWTRRLLAQPDSAVIPADLPMEARRTVAIAWLAACEHIRRAIVAHAGLAATAAADNGASYIDIGDAVGKTKQGARVQFPNLADRMKAARRATGEQNGSIEPPGADHATEPDTVAEPGDN